MRKGGHAGYRPDRLVAAVTARLPVILAEVRDTLADQHPDYAEFVTEEFDAVLVAARGFMTELLGACEDHPGVSAPAWACQQALFEQIGRAHWHQGLDITILLTAYRAGATVAWRHVTLLALDTGVPAESLASLASAMFAAIDQLSAASLRGYAREEAASFRDRHRRRSELAELLLCDRSSSAVVRATAEQVGWPLPRAACVVLVDRDNDVGHALLARLGDVVLRVDRADHLVAIVPDPAGPGRRLWLCSTLRGANAVVGAAVPLSRLPASVDSALLAARLRRTGVCDDDPLFVTDHLDALIVHQDERLLTGLRQQCLAPLDGLSGPARDRLSSTLRSWLLHMGNHKAVAEEMVVHPQTVRYRLARLRELFGTALDDPTTRANLLLALAWGPPSEAGDAAVEGPGTTKVEAGGPLGDLGPAVRRRLPPGAVSARQRRGVGAPGHRAVR